MHIEKTELKSLCIRVSVVKLSVVFQILRQKIEDILHLILR